MIRGFKLRLRLRLALYPYLERVELRGCLVGKAGGKDNLFGSGILYCGDVLSFCVRSKRGTDFGTVAYYLVFASSYLRDLVLRIGVGWSTETFLAVNFLFSRLGLESISLYY